MLTFQEQIVLLHTLFINVDKHTVPVLNKYFQLFYVIRNENVTRDLYICFPLMLNQSKVFDHCFNIFEDCSYLSYYFVSSVYKKEYVQKYLISIM